MCSPGSRDRLRRGMIGCARRRAHHDRLTFVKSGRASDEKKIPVLSSQQSSRALPYRTARLTGACAAALSTTSLVKRGDETRRTPHRVRGASRTGADGISGSDHRRRPALVYTT